MVLIISELKLKGYGLRIFENRGVTWIFTFSICLVHCETVFLPCSVLVMHHRLKSCLTRLTKRLHVNWKRSVAAFIITTSIFFSTAVILILSEWISNFLLEVCNVNELLFKALW